MIIVWVNKRDWKTPGPIVNMAVHNAASFSDLGYESHLCIGAGLPSHTRKDLETFYEITHRPHFRIHRIPRYRLGNATYSVSVFFHAYKLIKELSRRDQVAVFTRDSGFLFFLHRLCKKIKTVKGYYELHDMYADLSWVTDKKGSHYRENFYENLMLPRINGIVCITKAQERLYNAIFPHLPSCGFPLGTHPHTGTNSPEEKRKRRTLMYVGHMHGEKGIDFLLHAAKRLSRRDVRLLFWGGKAKKIPALEKRARDLSISSHVSFVPFQPPAKMHRAMAREASLGVVMLKDTYYNRYLTCPIKALDYLSHGIPAIGSDLPSVYEVLDRAGTYVAPDDVNAFIQAVCSLLDDPVRYEQKAKWSSLRAEEISWRMRARALANFAGAG